MEFISEIKPIKEGGIELKNRNDIEKLVEIPILESCQILYDKNIKTIHSSANFNNIGESAYILIDYDSLSNDNKKIAKKLGSIGKLNNSNTVKIEIPIESEKTLIINIHNNMKNLVSQFKKQKLNWGYYTIFELLNAYGISIDITEKEKNNFVKSLNMFYNKENELVFFSKELYNKFISY